MDERKKKTENKVEDVEVPDVDDEIQNWCNIPTKSDDRKSADDIVIDSWCEATVDDEGSEKKEKHKKQ